MAKKKHQSKKHRFKHADSGPVAAAVAVSDGSTSQGAAVSSRPGRLVAADMRDFSYVFSDLHRIVWWAGGLIILEFVLWYALNHTGLGSAVYGLFQV